MDFILYGLQVILTIIEDESIDSVYKWINKDCQGNVCMDHTIQFAVYIIETYKDQEPTAANLASGILNALQIDIDDAMNEYGMDSEIPMSPSPVPKIKINAKSDSVFKNNNPHMVPSPKGMGLRQSETNTYCAPEAVSYQELEQKKYYQTYYQQQQQQQQQQQYLYYQQQQQQQRLFAMQQQYRLSNGMQPYLFNNYAMPYQRASIQQPQLQQPPQQPMKNLHDRRESHMNVKLPTLQKPTVVHRKSSDVHISHKMHSTLANLLKVGSVMTKYPSVHTDHANHLEIQSQKRSKFKLVRMDANWTNIEFHNIRSADIKKEAQNIHLIKGKAPKRLPLCNMKYIDSSFSRRNGKQSVFSSSKHSKEILVYASDRKGKEIVIKLVCFNQNIAKRWTRAFNQIIVLMKN